MSIPAFWGLETRQVAGPPLTVWTRPHEQTTRSKTKPSASDSRFLLRTSAGLGSRLVSQPSKKSVPIPYIYTILRLKSRLLRRTPSSRYSLPRLNPSQLVIADECWFGNLPVYTADRYMYAYVEIGSPDDGGLVLVLTGFGRGHEAHVSSSTPFWRSPPLNMTTLCRSWTGSVEAMERTHMFSSLSRVARRRIHKPLWRQARRDRIVNSGSVGRSHRGPLTFGCCVGGLYSRTSAIMKIIKLADHIDHTLVNVSS